MNYGDYNPHPQQKPAMIQVRLYRPSTGSGLTVTVPQGADPETILANYPGWEFEAS